jgi:hypothetical protein
MSEPTQAQPAPQPAPLEMQVQIPQCDLKMVEGFSRVWRKNAIILAVLDQTSKEFARDFANMVLKSFVIEQAQRIMKMQAEAAAVRAADSGMVKDCTPLPQKNLIIA